MVEQRFGKIIPISAIIILAVVISITAAGIFLHKSTIPAITAYKQVFLASPFNNKEEYEDIFAKLQKPAENPEAKAGIISHQFLARQLIADFYNKIESDKVSTIFLISPDHYGIFFPKETIAYTSYATWQTPFGDLPANRKNIDLLQANGNIKNDDSLLGLEHGIYVEMPFIKNFFPNANIVPLLLNMSAGDDNFIKLGEQLKNMAGESSILIVSSDFSHDMSVQEADINDKNSIEVLRNLKADKLNGVTNDCRQCLAVLSGFLPNDKNYSFNLMDNKNSFDFSGEDRNSVTSYVSGFYAEKKDIKLLFVGDLMFDRGIRYYAEKNGGNEFIFDKIYPTLANNDLVVANLEGPITGNKSISAGTVSGSTNNYYFTFDPDVAETLYRENVKLVDLGNNHIKNFGTAGVDSTIKYLSNANVDYFGVPNGKRSEINNIDGVNITFVSYNDFNGDPVIEQNRTIDEIKKDKLQADIIIVFSHWGNEYQSKETDYQKNIAHKFIDASADLIIGSHPHVIQPMEEYKGKRIYYSLGNFIFDQYFSKDVRNGLGVEIKINPITKQLDFNDVNFYLDNNGQTVEKNDKK